MAESDRQLRQHFPQDGQAASDNRTMSGHHRGINPFQHSIDVVDVPEGVRRSLSLSVAGPECAVVQSAQPLPSLLVDGFFQVQAPVRSVVHAFAAWLPRQQCPQSGFESDQVWRKASVKPADGVPVSGHLALEIDMGPGNPQLDDPFR
ncbi:hypothetical protein [Streptomyces prunicolor]|uniref:hypothetical protein n=1 Tax=Streptomyces prunicolor TaxID=67348 RepID=UPI0033F8CEEB